MKDFEKFVKHLKLEAIALAVLMLVLTAESRFSLWVIPATFLFFDAGMIGYIKDEKIGAKLYNLSHSLFIPTLMIALGILISKDIVSVIGYCWTFHIATDRGLGYGLKMQSSFHHTHLGTIKNKKK